MIQIPKRFIQAFFLLLISIIFVADLALVDWVKKEAIDRPTEIVFIRETAPEDQIEGVSEVVEEQETPVEKKEPFCYISDDERYTIACIIAGESGNYSMELKMAVAQTIYTAMQFEDCGVDGVIARYDGYWDGSSVPDDIWQECLEAVERVFDNGELVTEESIEFFYNPAYCDSDWHETLTYVTTIDGCRFFER